VTIKAVVADDHEAVRYAVRRILERERLVVVVGEASDGREAVEAVARLKPDVVILDVTMPHLWGPGAASQIKRTNPNTGIIFYTMHGTSEHIYGALKIGVQGYLLKSSGLRQLSVAVSAVAGGGTYFDSSLPRETIESARRCGAESPLECLSGREQEVLQLVAEGKSSVAIAAELGLAPGTVDVYRHRVMTKLGVSSAVQLGCFAAEHGVTPLT